MPASSPARIILVAGVPRSGSTWVFNAARLLLTHAGRDLQAAWVADYRPDHPAPTHLVKAHRRVEVTFEPELVLTTRRPTAACLASLVRMGWLADTPEAIRERWRQHRALYDYWQARSHLEIAYDEIVGAPQRALEDLAGVLALVPSEQDLKGIAKALEDMRAPRGGAYDPETLLHPRHRGSGATSRSPEEILRIVAG